MSTSNFSDLTATFINCTLKKSPRQSHTQGLIDLSTRILENEKVTVKQTRLVDHEVATGIYPDMTKEGWEKDEWPELFSTIITSDILIIGTPIWLGEKSSIASKLI